VGNNNDLFALFAAIVSVVGAIISLYKSKPEKKKIEAEGESALGSAAESIATGAKVSNELLLDRIIELESKNKEMSAKLLTVTADMANMKNDLDAWQDWASRLVHQVRSLGHEPVPFIHPKMKVDTNEA
jgi:hypothetical protein